MDETIYLLEPVLGAENLDQRLMLLLQACDEQQAFALKPQNKIQTVVATVNRRLNTAASRSAGLHLLKTFLTQCSDDVFCEHAVSWMVQCLKGIDKHNKENTEGLSYDTLRMLLRMASKFPELVKPISASVIPKFMEQIQHAQNKRAAVSCLEIILRFFGGSCKSQKNMLERFILTFVDNEDFELVQSVAECACYLPLIGGSGIGGTNHKDAWNKLSLQLCAAANDVLDQLFANITELHLSSHLTNISSDVLSLPEVVEQNPILCAHHLCTRFINLIHFLCAMLCGEFPVIKTIRPDIILALACRGLAVNCSTLASGVSSEHVALVSVLPRLHTSLLQVIQKLVICCGGSLLRYGPLICKLVQQTLKWTSAPNWGYGMEKPYRQLREAACTLLESWMLKVRSASCAELLADQLVPLLLPDAFSTPATITLQVQILGKKHLTKQQRRQLQQKQKQEKAPEPVDTQGSTRIRLVDSKVNANLCQSSLKALCALMQAAGPFLKPTLHKQVQETVVALLLEIQRASGPDDLPVPYATSGPRLQLYRLLLALVQNPHPHWPPPVHLALKCFSAGQHDTSLEVVGFCSEALSSMRQVIHPPHPSLHMATPVSDHLDHSVFESSSKSTPLEKAGKELNAEEVVAEKVSNTNKVEEVVLLNGKTSQAKRMKYDHTTSKSDKPCLLTIDSDNSDESSTLVVCIDSDSDSGKCSKSVKTQNNSIEDEGEIAYAKKCPENEKASNCVKKVTQTVAKKVRATSPCNKDKNDTPHEKPLISPGSSKKADSKTAEQCSHSPKIYQNPKGENTLANKQSPLKNSVNDQDGNEGIVTQAADGEEKSDAPVKKIHDVVIEELSEFEVNKCKGVFQENENQCNVDIVLTDDSDCEVLSCNKRGSVEIEEISGENDDVVSSKDCSENSNKKVAVSKSPSQLVSDPSDKEIEEPGDLDLNAVEISLRVSEENSPSPGERPSAEGEPVAKRARIDNDETKSSDSSDEEELLKSFVDAIAPEAMNNE